jgi:predicted Zn-dependent protease
VFGRPGSGTRVGERLTPAPVSLRSDPSAPGLESAPVVLAGASSDSASVFDNGVPIGPASWIDRGTLTALPSTRHTAALADLPFTPPTDNLLVDVAGGRGGALDLVRDLDDGLLLTCLWYIREVDPQTLLLTGLTRDGVFLVENGEVTGAVNNFRFNESPVDLLGRTVQAGRTERTLPREWNDWFTRAAMPPIRVPDFNMSSVSPAS